MESSDSESCVSTSPEVRCKRRRSTASCSCGGWHVDTGSLTSDILQDVGLALIDDVTEGAVSGGDNEGLNAVSLPTPPNSQLECSSSAGDCALDSYSAGLEHYIPGDFITYKKHKFCDNALSDPFSRLSDELLLKIFAQLRRHCLSRCIRVCRRWRHLCTDESLWRRVDAAGRTFSPGQLGRLLQRGVRILRLARSEICTPIFCDPVSLQSDCVSVCRVQYLDLSMASISAPGVEQLLCACQRLVKLSLERCALTDLACSSLALNSELEVLNCALATGLTQTGLSRILNGCSKLRQLNVGWCEFDTNAISTLVSSLPETITHLNLSGTKDHISDEHVVELMERVGAGLKVLDLSDASAISRKAYKALLQHLTVVEHLALSRCYQLPGIRCTDLLSLGSLRFLDMFGCFSDSGVEALKRALPALKINNLPLSTVARPTVGIRRTSIWQLAVSQL